MNIDLLVLTLVVIVTSSEMHGIVGRAWCYDRCIYALTTDDLHMQFDIIIITYKHNTYTVLSLQGQWYLRKL